MRLYLPVDGDGIAQFPGNVSREFWLRMGLPSRHNLINIAKESGQQYTYLQEQSLLNLGLVGSQIQEGDNSEGEDGYIRHRENEQEDETCRAGNVEGWARPNENDEGEMRREENIDPNLRSNARGLGDERQNRGGIGNTSTSPSPIAPPPFLPPHPIQGVPTMRGNLASRGKIKRVRSQKRKYGEEVHINDLMANTIPAGKVDLRKPKKELHDEAAQLAKLKLREIVRVKFRELCGVEQKDSWPNPSTDRRNSGTNELYLTPYFDQEVTYSKNRKLFQKIAELVESDLELSCPPELHKTNHRWTWNRSTVEQLSKDCFNAFKKDWRAQNDVDRMQAKKAAERISRWTKRRVDKAKYLKDKAAKLYTEKYGVDPTPLIREEYMSDEASGPEEGQNDVEWMRRMATARHMDVEQMQESELYTHKFYEVIKPEWRSEEASKLYEELNTIFWSTRKKEDLQRFKGLRVRGSGRTDPRPPSIAPYNSAISQKWYDEHNDKPSHRDSMLDYFSYNDPVGFGTNKGGVPNESVPLQNIA